MVLFTSTQTSAEPSHLFFIQGFPGLRGDKGERGEKGDKVSLDCTDADIFLIYLEKHRRSLPLNLEHLLRRGEIPQKEMALSS